MTNTPGDEQPPTPEQPDPPGWWEQQAPGAPQPGQPPYPGWGQQPGQPPDAGWGQHPGWGPPPGYAAWGPAYPPLPRQQSAQTAMILGLIGLAGAPFCLGLTLFLSPFAWGMGKESLNEIEASNGTLGGRDEARTAYVTGLIGTVLLVLGFLAVVGFVVLAVAVSG
jgi:hypothetical protein